MKEKGYYWMQKELQELREKVSEMYAPYFSQKSGPVYLLPDDASERQH